MGNEQEEESLGFSLVQHAVLDGAPLAPALVIRDRRRRLLALFRRGDSAIRVPRSLRRSKCKELECIGRVVQGGRQQDVVVLGRFRLSLGRFRARFAFWGW